MNTERDVNNRRGWKAETFPYDYYTIEPGKECQYCLTDKQVEVLLGIVEPLAWHTRWFSDTQDIDREIIRQFRDDITRRLMMGCCNDDVIYRYDEDGNLESSDDGGTVFTPDPGADIRINPQTTFPEPPTVEGQDKKCVAADAAVTLIREQIGDQLTDDMSRYTLGQLINDWTQTIVGTSNPFTALVTVISNQIFALLISAVRASLTDDVYSQLNCIFYCHMDEHCFFSGAAWENVRSDILSDISGVAGMFLEHLVYLLGNGGISNLARSGAGNGSATCDDCHCDDTWCKTFDFTDQSFSAYWSSYNTASNPAVFNSAYIDGVGWQTLNAAPNYTVIKIAMNTHKLTRVTFVEDPAHGGPMFMGILPSATGDPLVNYGISDRNFDGSEPVGTYLAIGQRDTGIMTSVTLEGTGSNPFGANNC
jgi:hypothetical protein